MTIQLSYLSMQKIECFLARFIFYQIHYSPSRCITFHIFSFLFLWSILLCNAKLHFEFIRSFLVHTCRSPTKDSCCEAFDRTTSLRLIETKGGSTISIRKIFSRIAYLSSREIIWIRGFDFSEIQSEIARNTLYLWRFFLMKNVVRGKRNSCTWSISTVSGHVNHLQSQQFPRQKSTDGNA